MNILIAPNAFKNSLDAEEAAIAIQEGLNKSRLKASCTCFPVADGGDGTGALLVKKLGGIRVPAPAHDALGRPIQTSFGLVDGGRTAVIEMADAAGLRLLRKEELNPLRATSYGTGEQIKAALDRNARKIIVCMGGSATVDGGAGILSALGVRFLDAGGRELAHLPEDLVQLAHMDASRLDKRIYDSEIIILCDVDNVLLGEHGAAAIFGPQKGAGPADVPRLEAALAKFAAITQQITGIDIACLKHAGTAGGAAAGLHAFLQATFVKGIDYFLELTGFDASLEAADLVITGEGSIDEQTLQGKGPFGVAYKARQKQIPVIALAGKIPLQENSALAEYFNVLFAIGNGPSGMEAACRHTRENLVRVSCQTGNLLAMRKENSPRFTT